METSTPITGLVLLKPRIFTDEGGIYPNLSGGPWAKRKLPENAEGSTWFKQVRSLSAYYHGGSLFNLVAGTLERLVTNADGTTSLKTRVPGSSPGGPPKHMGTIAPMVEHCFIDLVVTT